MKKTISLKNLSLLINILFVFLIVKTANAADFLVSWKANSYVPASYEGKIFPTKNSPVEISFDLIDGGKQANISKNEIRWFIDGKLINSGLGMKTFSFKATKNGGSDHLVKIVIVNYKEENQEYTTTIPVVNPEAIIDLRRPDNSIGFGENRFQALPYFFNVTNATDLKFQWSANNEQASGNPSSPDILVLELNSPNNKAMSLNLGVLVQSPFDQLELSGKTFNLTVK